MTNFLMDLRDDYVPEYTIEIVRVASEITFNQATVKILDDDWSLIVIIITIGMVMK